LGAARETRVEVNRRVIKREEAKCDLDDHAAFIQKDSPDSAIRFLEAAEECFQGLAEMRYKGIQYPTLQGSRDIEAIFNP